jgi:hypothetical protein
MVHLGHISMAARVNAVNTRPVPPSDNSNWSLHPISKNAALNCQRKKINSSTRQTREYVKMSGRTPGRTPAKALPRRVPFLENSGPNERDRWNKIQNITDNTFTGCVCDSDVFELRSTVDGDSDIMLKQKRGKKIMMFPFDSSSILGRLFDLSR